MHGRCAGYAYHVDVSYTSFCASPCPPDKHNKIFYTAHIHNTQMPSILQTQLHNPVRPPPLRDSAPTAVQQQPGQQQRQQVQLTIQSPPQQAPPSNRPQTQAQSAEAVATGYSSASQTGKAAPLQFGAEEPYSHTAAEAWRQKTHFLCNLPTAAPAVEVPGPRVEASAAANPPAAVPEQLPPALELLDRDVNIVY